MDNPTNLSAWQNACPYTAEVWKNLVVRNQRDHYAFRRDEDLSHFAGRREILNDNFLYIWIYKWSIDLNTFTELLI